MEIIKELVYLVKEEWIYHLINIVILIGFSLFGAYKSMRYVLDKDKTYIKEFMKAFGVLFGLYLFYILYRAGYLIP